MERLGSDLQVQVRNLVVSLREITKRERQEIIKRVHEDCSKVREDMSQTLSIQHYLASLLAETDPFLLIWVRLWTDFHLVRPAKHSQPTADYCLLKVWCMICVWVNIN